MYFPAYADALYTCLNCSTAASVRSLVTAFPTQYLLSFFLSFEDWLGRTAQSTWQDCNDELLCYTNATKPCAKGNIAVSVCVQPNVKPQPEEDGGESVSTPTITTTGVSNVQVDPSLAPYPPHQLQFTAWCFMSCVAPDTQDPFSILVVWGL